MPPEFDAIAQQYDATFTHTPLGKILRQRVWDLYKKQAINARQALELNCGTGEDALWLARQGMQVLATDAAPQMVACAQAKIEAAGLEHQINTRVCAFQATDTLPNQAFDVIFSNFGGLNCLSPESLRPLGEALQQKLRPDGHLILVVMGRFCLWESLYFLLKGKFKSAFRRKEGGPVLAKIDHTTSVPTWYYAPKELIKLLGLSVEGARIYPLGFWLPPSYLNPFLVKYPRLLHSLNWLEKRCHPRWLAGLSDHYFLYWTPQVTQ